MSVERHPMTPYGFQQLKAELKKIREIDKPANVKAIEEARAHGDLSENAEYTYAKEQQGFIYGREKEVEALIATADVIDPATLSGERVVFGATVQLLDVDTDEEITYTIVGENESDSNHGRVSIKSPIARALIGKRIGDEAIVNAPKGKRTFEVLDIKFLSVDTWEF
ncbi:MAG: transcription elongation factor GreA [Proteobacteria bacterium]|nr:transcription elongation factor GreA [Pseudomonadota bacterium]MBQ9242220.1 transcription elongation factor GreA [Pseudomonadota bacterium]